MKKLLSFIALGLMATMSANATIEQDTDGYFKITSAADWKEFAVNVNTKNTEAISDGSETTWATANAKLTADIEIATAQNFAANYFIGHTTSNPYKGTFDGQGHTVTMPEKNGLTNMVGIFGAIDGATIKNLRAVSAAGTKMESNQQYNGGLVAYSTGGTIENCYSALNVSTTYSTNDLVVGGILGRAHSGTTTITNCMYAGTLSATSETKSGICGMVGYVKDGTTTVSNCLYAGTITSTTTTNNRTISRAANSTYLTVTNSYYTNNTNCTATSGSTLAAEADLLSGKIAYTLQGEQSTQYWGQSKLNTYKAATLPELTSATADKVVSLPVANTQTTLYANAGGAMPNPAKIGALYWVTAQGGSTAQTTAPETDKTTIYRNVKQYPLTITSAGCSTLLLPVEATIPDGVTAFTLEVNSEGTKINATKITETTISANTPVLINAEAGTYIFKTSNESAISYDLTKEYTNGSLVGQYDYRYAPANTGYVLQKKAGTDAAFYQVATANTINVGPFRAYLKNSNAGGGTQSLEIVYDVQPTAISAVTTDNGQQTTAKVAKFFKNGKLVIVKDGKEYNVIGQQF